MARRGARPPTYRRRVIRGKKIAYVTLTDAETGRRRDYWLGEYGSPESRARYARLLASWEARGRRLPDGRGPVRPADGVTVSQVLAAYLPTIHDRYSDSHQASIRSAIRSFREHYGRQPANAVGPRMFRDWRDTLAAESSPQSANRKARIIIAVYRWAVAEELVEVDVYRRLKAVSPVRNTSPQPPTLPVPDDVIRATMRFVSRHVRAMVDLQLCTGMRPGEVCGMRLCEIDMGEDVWVYRPTEHKTAHRGRQRMIYLGPRAQEVLQPFLSRPVSAFVFSPAEAEAERRAAMHENRKTPLSCGNRPGTNRQLASSRRPGDRYMVGSYRRAIHRACDRAKCPRWSPHQLRHNYATEIRRRCGLEAARILLGHSSAIVTEAVYAERDEQAARRIVAEMG